MTAQLPSDTEPPLPTLYEALLNEAQLIELLMDLELAAQIHEVRMKSGATARSGTAALDLSALSSELWRNTNQSVQIIYTHRGRTWIDTLMRGPLGVKLVRMQQETRPA